MAVFIFLEDTDERCPRIPKIKPLTGGWSSDSQQDTTKWAEPSEGVYNLKEPRDGKAVLIQFLIQQSFSLEKHKRNWRKWGLSSKWHLIPGKTFMWGMEVSSVSFSYHRGWETLPFVYPLSCSCFLTTKPHSSAVSKGSPRNIVLALERVCLSCRNLNLLMAYRSLTAFVLLPASLSIALMKDLFQERAKGYWGRGIPTFPGVPKRRS